MDNESIMVLYLVLGIIVAFVMSFICCICCSKMLKNVETIPGGGILHASQTSRVSGGGRHNNIDGVGVGVLAMASLTSITCDTSNTFGGFQCGGGGGGWVGGGGGGGGGGF